MKRTPSTLASGEAIERNFSDALLLLRSVRETLSTLLQDALAGEEVSLRDVSTKQAELETALKRAFDAEDRFNAWSARSGAGVTAEVDFAALRDEIACRLGRIAECCHEQ